MSQIKHAQIRFRVIDKSLRNPYRPFPSKEDLRQACEEAIFGSIHGEHICDSTIEKDLFAMRMEHDAPIKYSKREKGYFYEDPEFTIDNIPLSMDDVDALKFAANTLIQFKNVPIFNQFEFAMQKILDRVEASHQLQTPDADFIQFEQGSNEISQSYLNQLMAAIQDRLQVKFVYQNFVGGQKKERKLEPYLLKEYRNRWYVIGFDWEKEKVITYALDRIEDLEVLSEKHVHEKDFDPEQFFQHTIGITVGDGNPEKVVFKADNIASKYITSQPLHESQKIIKEGKSRTTFELNVWITEELIRLILSYGGAIEVKSPKSLRTELKKRVAIMVNLYS